MQMSESGKWILCNNSVFITVISSKSNLTLVKMNSKEILLKEISSKVGYKINEQTISEKVNQFIKNGNLFLLFEVLSLRKDIERLKEEIEHQRTNEDRNSVHAVYIP